MNSFFSQLKKETRLIRLTSSEREGVRSVLERAMQEQEPAPEATPEPEVLQEKPVKSPIRLTPSPFLVLLPRLMAPLAFVLILAVVSSTTAYAAESALPGDLLYSVKVNVNEKVAVAFTRSPEKKAEAFTRFAERRMEEAEELTVRGVMTAEKKDKLEEHFETYTQKLEQALVAVEALDSVAAADIATRFESTVAAHSEVIERLAHASGSEESRDISSRFALALEGRSRARSSASTSVPAPEASSATMAMKAAESDEAGEGGSGEATNARMVAQDSARAAFAPSTTTTPADKDAQVAMRIVFNASTTLAEVESRFRMLEAQLNATTSEYTRAQISNLRERIRSFFEEGTSTATSQSEVQKASRDVARLKAFLGAQEKFREQTLLPVPEEDDREEEGVEENPEASGGDAERVLEEGAVLVDPVNITPLR